MVNKLFVIILIGISLLISGCPSEATGVDIKLKQVIPITPTTSIEITKDIDFSQIDTGSSQDYILANSKFRIPVEIKNNNNIDYEDVYIRVIKDSPIITTLLLYSYSGRPFGVYKEDIFKFDNKLISRQENELVLVGEVGDLPLNLTQGSMDFSLLLYELNQSQLIPIQDSYHPYKLKICKTSNC